MNKDMNNGYLADPDERTDSGICIDNMPHDYSNGIYYMDNKKHKYSCLTIIGQIEGHYLLSPENKTTKYEHILPELATIEENDNIDGLLILLNTVGGDIEAGLAIAELIAGMNKPSVSLVLGGGHSIGIPLAVAAKKSFIVKSASMTVHPVRMNGVFLGVPQTFSYFSGIQDRIIDFVCSNSSVDKNTFRKLMMNCEQLAMDTGTVLSGNEAVQYGIIDKIGSLSEALKALTEMVENKG